jgi:hypothetical protein
MYCATASPRQEQRSPVAIWSRVLALGLLAGGPATTSVAAAQRRTRGEIGSARATDRERDERDLLQFFRCTKQNLTSDGPGRKRARCTMVFLTYEIKSGFFTYHGFLTITSFKPY